MVRLIILIATEIWAPQVKFFVRNRTLVGSGLKQKSMLRRELASLIPPHIAHISENVASFDPAHNAVRTDSGRSLEYNALVVAMGLQVNFGAIEGLPKALADSSSGVSSIYSYQTCDKTWDDIDALRAGRAIFTQPQGVIKCAGGQHSISLPSPSLFQALNRLHPPPLLFSLCYALLQRLKRSCGWLGIGIARRVARIRSRWIFSRACRPCSV